MDNAIDNNIVLFFNQFAQRSHLFDLAVYHVLCSNMLKGGVLVALFYWVWFHDGRNDFSLRAKLTSILGFCIFAVVAARGLALCLPYRSRPLHTASLHFKIPFGLANEALEKWSSFPSDHAALFFTLSTGLFLVNRRIGAFALLHTIIVICLPRLYFGVHYPSDLLGGALLGVFAAWLACRPRISVRVARPFREWRERHEGSFYACFYLLTYQIADLFEHCRGLLSAVVKAFGKGA